MNDSKDNKDNAHGTGVASKTLDQIHGMVNEATLFSVVTNFYRMDVAEGFEEISKDIEKCINANDGQPPNCVIVCSTGGEGMKREEAVASKRFLKTFSTLHNIGLPIVLASGNNKDESRRIIDVIPQILENSDGVPLINVGAATKEGHIWPDTQIETETGPQLTIYIPKDRIATNRKTVLLESFPDGKSVAAPTLIKSDQTDTMPVPSEEECRQYLHEILNGCDNDLNPNPMNWKADGVFTLGGWEYRFMAANSRSAAPQRPLAWCTVRDGTVNVWETGCLSSDFGDQLRKSFNDINEKTDRNVYSTEK